MKLKALFEMQTLLDNRIHQQHQVTYLSTERSRLLAFAVELGELANETRCFKFWSLKPASSSETILEEYVDGLHFLLSYGIGLGFDALLEEIKAGQISVSLTDQFLKLFDFIPLVNPTISLEQYHLWFQAFLTLGLKLGFTENQIEKAYFQKNQVNHQRQDNHY